LLREGGRVQKHRFGTMTQELQELAEWLRQFGVTEVAMESSGVYWKPVWNILEGRFTVVLANAQHIKNVPGRKTDQKDAEWIAQLLQYGLLRASYTPCEIIRDLRDLTRTRASLSQEASRIRSRIQKVLEDANIKLASRATMNRSSRVRMEAWRQWLLGGRKNLVQQKEKRFDLTPTGLLMEGDYTHNPVLGNSW
jgi:transposase